MYERYRVAIAFPLGVLMMLLNHWAAARWIPLGGSCVYFQGVPFWAQISTQQGAVREPFQGGPFQALSWQQKASDLDTASYLGVAQ